MTIALLLLTLALPALDPHGDRWATDAAREREVRALWAEANAEAAEVRRAGVAPAALGLRIALTELRVAYIRAGVSVPADLPEAEAYLQAIGRSSLTTPELLLPWASKVRQMVVGPHDLTTDHAVEARGKLFAALDAIDARWR